MNVRNVRIGAPAASGTAPSFLKRWLRVAVLWCAVLVALGITFALLDGWKAFGHGAIGERRARMERSPQWKDGHFENPEPLVNDLWGSLMGMIDASTDRTPTTPIQVEPIGPDRFATPPASGLRVTWFGHSSMLVELDGHRVLTDPVWSERVSPVSIVGPTRWYPPPIAIDQLPELDAVVISHDHYDHLDYPTIAALNRRGVRFIVPLGLGSHLSYWGVPDERIEELDWWELTQIGDLRIVCTPARHASGRTMFDKDATLWAGWALLGPKHRAYFSGDTGLFPAMKDIGTRLGPFDVTMIETGQYHGSWPDWHIGPEQAVLAHRLVQGRAMIPMHWALLTLAYHGWTEPAERLSAEAMRDGATLLTPRPGQSIEPGTSTAHEHWWPKVPWETAAQAPIISTQIPPELRNAEPTAPASVAQ